MMESLTTLFHYKVTTHRGNLHYWSVFGKVMAKSAMTNLQYHPVLIFHPLFEDTNRVIKKTQL